MDAQNPSPGSARSRSATGETRTNNAAWTGMVSVDDTALAVTDTGGAGTALVYLNGAYADQAHWRRVIADLGDTYRHVTYDERARGRSERSADYSFEACVRDLTAVLDARGIERAVLVGWSLGAHVAAHWTDRHADRVIGVVAVDGAIPYGLTGEEGRARIRKLFRRWRLLFPLASRLGLAARMTADEHADVNIEANEVSAALGPVLERLTRPVRYVLATGGNLGSNAAEMEAVRASLDHPLAVNPNLRVSAKVPTGHGSILRKEHLAIATAVREVAEMASPA